MTNDLVDVVDGLSFLQIFALLQWIIIKYLLGVILMRKQL
jgi:hypothetical protein